MTNFKLNHATGLLNDGSADAPKLQVWLNLDNLLNLRADTIWPGLEGTARIRHLAEDGFEGVQLTSADPMPPNAPLPFCGVDSIITPDTADAVVAKHRDRGDACITVHAGVGLEDEDDVVALVAAILKASGKHSLPVFIETHRATITQDLWRTAQIARRFPEVRFNGDFSHYYCGQEMVYGGFEMKLDFMQPIFSRIGFLHGRIASPGCMQVSIDDLESKPRQAHGRHDYLAHFKEMWTRAMQGFLRIAGPGDLLIFAPELLAGHIYYARLFPDAHGQLVEESDRYAQALLYKDIARQCSAEAQRAIL